MNKKLKVLVSVCALTLMGMSAASAEEINIGDFRNIVTGVNTNTATSINVQKQVGWQNINNTWYYFKESGIKQTGWLNDKGTWYYFDQTGAMQHDTIVYGFYLDSSGAWTKNI